MKVYSVLFLENKRVMNIQEEIDILTNNPHWKDEVQEIVSKYRDHSVEYDKLLDENLEELMTDIIVQLQEDLPNDVVTYDDALIEALVGKKVTVQYCMWLKRQQCPSGESFISQIEQATVDVLRSHLMRSITIES